MVLDACDQHIDIIGDGPCSGGRHAVTGERCDRRCQAMQICTHGTVTDAHPDQVCVGRVA